MTALLALLGLCLPVVTIGYLLRVRVLAVGDLLAGAAPAARTGPAGPATAPACGPASPGRLYAYLRRLYRDGTR